MLHGGAFWNSLHVFVRSSTGIINSKHIPWQIGTRCLRLSPCKDPLVYVHTWMYWALVTSRSTNIYTVAVKRSRRAVHFLFARWMNHNSRRDVFSNSPARRARCCCRSLLCGRNDGTLFNEFIIRVLNYRLCIFLTRQKVDEPLPFDTHVRKFLGAGISNFTAPTKPFSRATENKPFAPATRLSQTNVFFPPLPVLLNTLSQKTGSEFFLNFFKHFLLFIKQQHIHVQFLWAWDIEIWRHGEL